MVTYRLVRFKDRAMSNIYGFYSFKCFICCHRCNFHAPAWKNKFSVLSYETESRINQTQTWWTALKYSTKNLNQVNDNKGWNLIHKADWCLMFVDQYFIFCYTRDAETMGNNNYQNLIKVAFLVAMSTVQNTRYKMCGHKCLWSFLWAQ